MVLRCIIEKEEPDGQKITNIFTSSSKQKVIFNRRSTRQFISSSEADLDRNIKSLEGMPSGFRVREIVSLTLVSTPLPPILGGCGYILKRTKKYSERRGLFDIDGPPGSKRCLQDAILFSIFGKEAFSDIRSQNILFSWKLLLFVQERSDL